MHRWIFFGMMKPTSHTKKKKKKATFCYATFLLFLFPSVIPNKGSGGRWCRELPCPPSHLNVNSSNHSPAPIHPVWPKWPQENGVTGSWESWQNWFGSRNQKETKRERKRTNKFLLKGNKIEFLLFALIRHEVGGGEICIHNDFSITIITAAVNHFI